MEEIWKDIVGFEGLYQVSNMGRVKSLERDWICGNHNSVRHLEEHIVEPEKMKKGYLRISLNKDGVRKRIMLHRLVAEAFIPNPNNLPQVNHKNEDKALNTVENLEWCTNEYNHNYGTHNQRVSEAMVNNPKRSKLVYQYTLDGELVAIWSSTNECGRNGYGQGMVAACCRGEYGRRTYKGHKWSYKPL